MADLTSKNIEIKMKLIDITNIKIEIIISKKLINSKNCSMLA